VYSVEDKDELEQFVASPKVNVYHYGPGSSYLTKAYSQKLEEIKNQVLSGQKLRWLFLIVFD